MAGDRWAILSVDMAALRTCDERKSSGGASILAALVRRVNMEARTASSVQRR
jgi:hypothetical protein